MLTSLVVFRHALAGKRSQWEDDDRTRPLDGTGVAQSLVMAARLGAIPLDRILTSPYVRCSQSVAPLAAYRRLPVSFVPWLGSGCTEDEALAGLAGLSGNVLLCTHGECVAPLLSAVDTVFGLPPDHPTKLKKGEALHLDLGAGSAPRPAEVELIPVPPLEGARKVLAELGIETA